LKDWGHMCTHFEMQQSYLEALGTDVLSNLAARLLTEINSSIALIQSISTILYVV